MDSETPIPETPVETPQNELRVGMDSETPTPETEKASNVRRFFNSLSIPWLSQMVGPTPALIITMCLLVFGVGFTGLESYAQYMRESPLQVALSQICISASLFLGFAFWRYLPVTLLTAVIVITGIASGLVSSTIIVWPYCVVCLLMIVFRGVDHANELLPSFIARRKEKRCSDWSG